MYTASTSARAALHDTVFVKTDKGRAELAARSAGLKSRQRTLLILLDGQKRLADIAGLPEDERAETITHLLALGLVVPMTQNVPVTPQEAPADAEALARLAGIKALMTDSANTYLGLMAADVVRRVQRARDETELYSVVGHWHMAMRDSKYGRDAAETYLAHIRGHFGAGFT